MFIEVSDGFYLNQVHIVSIQKVIADNAMHRVFIEYHFNGKSKISYKDFVAGAVADEFVRNLTTSKPSLPSQ